MDSGLRRNDVVIFYAIRVERSSLIFLESESKNVGVPQGLG